MTDSQQRREDAARREEQLREDAQRATASAQNHNESPSASGQPSGQRGSIPSPTHNSASQAQNDASDAATSGQAQGRTATPTDASPARSQGGRRRNHHRSRRLGKLKKTPVGAPPPELAEEELLDESESGRPLLFPSGIGPGASGRERERS